MRSRLVAIMATLGLLGLTTSAGAHHAFAAAYDESSPIDFQGTITKLELINPHSWIWVDVKGEDGTVVNWGIEGGPPNNLFRNGITKTSLPVGTVIRIVGYRSRSGENKGVGVFLSNAADGKKLFLGGAAPGASGP
jgi:Family of unknown function (DUF6152)